jgi:hypothetical protein
VSAPPSFLTVSESIPWVLGGDFADGGTRRRTHQSGPLGELFDHGVDALNTSFECLIFAASQNLGMGWKTVATLFACESCNPPQLSGPPANL